MKQIEYNLVKCITFSGIVIIHNDFLSLCNKQSGFSKAVFAGLINRYLKKLVNFQWKNENFLIEFIFLSFSVRNNR